GLLAGGGRRAPDADALLARARGQQSRHDDGAEMLERDLVAEEERLVGGHRLDHFDGERRGGGGGFKLADQLAETGQSVLARDRQQAAFGEVLLLGRQHQAGALAQQLAQIVEILRGHALSPANRRVRRGAISSSGSTAEQRPACATWPGMPHTTLVGSSCVRMQPPSAAIACAPRKPSEPMPVSTRPSTFGPQTSAAEENSGSTAGLQKLTSGPSPSVMTAMPSRRTTAMWAPAGAR